MEREHDLARWLAGEMNKEELQAFEKSDGFATYQKIAEHTKRFQAPEFNGDAVLAAVLSHPKKKQAKVVPLYVKNILRIAAVLVIGLGLWFSTREDKVAAYVADAGKQTSFQLPDASEVTLNSGSEASFTEDDWSDERKVELKGEAFFRVAKGKKFEVCTNQGTVTVLGTQFNVRARANRFEVECFEGKVDVKSGDNHTIITKGQVVAFEKGKAVAIMPQAGARPGWMQGELVFRAETLEQIASELERHFGIKIDIPAQASKERFTGVMPGDDPLIALHVIGRTYKLDIRQKSAKTFILDAME